MKKILFVSLAIILCAGMAFAYTPPGKGDIMGAGHLDSTPGKIFRLVRYMPTSATTISPKLTAESIVIWDTVSDDGVTVTLTTTSADPRVAGVVVNDILTPEYGGIGDTAANDIGKRNWGYLQTYGYAKVYCASEGGMALGQGFGTSSISSLASSHTVTATPGANAGFAYDIGATGGEVEVFLKGLD